MNIISVSYGNDSIAMIRWAHEMDLPDAHVVYCDTGWSHSSWEKRIAEGKALAESYGFTTAHIKGDFSFPEMVRMKKGFPYNRSQFCTGILKGLPFLDYCEEIDPDGDAVILIGKRRVESQARKDTPEYVESSEYHAGRQVWHPLYLHTDAQRNRLIEKTGMAVLPHRSLECCPCVNAGKSDFTMIEPDRIAEIRDLESEIKHTMFRPAKKMGAHGIDEVLKWAVSPRGTYGDGQMNLFDEFFGTPCELGLCGS